MAGRVTWSFYSEGGLFCSLGHHRVEREAAIAGRGGRLLCPVHRRQLRLKSGAQAKSVRRRRLRQKVGQVEVCTLKARREGAFWVCDNCGYKEFA